MNEYLGRGIYIISEVSRLTGIRATTVRRWVEGYRYVRNASARLSVPVFGTEYGAIEGKTALSFLDLVEIRFIEVFRSYGVSWPTIRVASLRAAELLDCAHPFAKKVFYTDRRTIFARISQGSDDVALIDLAKRQYAIDKILSPYLHSGLEFNGEEVAERWWPKGKQAGIVVDPKRNFGRPIMDKYNVPTRVLASALRAGASIREVAEWYEVDEESVQAAADFEVKSAA